MFVRTTYVIAKFKKNIPTLVVSNLAAKKQKRTMLDITSSEVSSQGGNKYWLLVLDEFITQMKWDFFLKKKSELGVMSYITHFCNKSNEESQYDLHLVPM